MQLSWIRAIQINKLIIDFEKLYKGGDLITVCFYKNQQMRQIQEGFQSKLYEINYNLNQNPHNVIAHKRIKTSKNKTVVSPFSTMNPTLEQEQFNTLSINYQLKNFKQNAKYRSQNSSLQKNDKIGEVDDGNLEKKNSDHTRSIRSSLRKIARSNTFESESRWSKNKGKQQRKLSIQQKNSLGNVKEMGKQTSKLFKNKRGPLEQKHLMNWLNYILVEYCFEDSEKDVHMRGLQRYALDKNSLLSKGLSPESICRLYQTLFVHSFGLHNCIKELSLNNRSTMKSVWKVYTLLLEYISEGNFQTLMGEIERDMIQNEKRLLGEIEKRQKIINANEQIIQLRMQKYDKQNKQLKKQLKETEQKMQQLQNQFREIQIAYNMEVTLRLTYEHKINKIYSVHQRLNILHNNLLRDFQNTDEINKKITIDKQKVKEQNIQTNANYLESLAQINQLENIIRSKDSTIQGLKMNQFQLTQKINKQTKMKRDQALELRQKQKRISHLQQQLRSTNLIIEMMKSSANSHYQEHRRIATENVQIKRLNFQQITKISQLLSQVKYLNNKESQIRLEFNHMQAKNNQLKQQTIQKNDQISSLKQQIDKKDIQLRKRQLTLECQIKISESFEKNVKGLKQVVERLQEQNLGYSKYSKEIEQQLKVIHSQKLQIELKYKALLEQKFEMQLELSKRVTEILTLRKKYQSQNQQQIRKYQILHKVWNGQEKSQNSLAEDLAITRDQLEKANFRIAFLSQQFVDLNFQKSKIESLYKDNLILHDKEKQSEKNLMMNISTLNERISDAKRELNIQSKNHHQDQQQWKKTQQKLNLIIEKQKIVIFKKQGFVHPLLLEDALHTLQREIQSHQKDQNFFQMTLEKQRQKSILMKIQFQRKESEFKQHLKQTEKKVQQTRNELQKQRQYFREKTEQLRLLNYQLEDKLHFHKVQKEKKQQKENSNESKMTEMIKAKNAQITELLNELEKIQDNFQKKSLTYEAEIQLIQKQNEKVIFQLKQSKKQMQQKIVTIQKQFKQKLNEKQKQMSEMVSRGSIIQNEVGDKYQDKDKGEIIKVRTTSLGSKQLKRSEFIAKFKIVTLKKLM